jgi:hypothetical protein
MSRPRSEPEITTDQRATSVLGVAHLGATPPFHGSTHTPRRILGTPADFNAGLRKTPADQALKAFSRSGRGTPVTHSLARSACSRQPALMRPLTHVAGARRCTLGISAEVSFSGLYGAWWIACLKELRARRHPRLKDISHEGREKSVAIVTTPMLRRGPGRLRSPPTQGQVSKRLQRG